MSDTVADDSLAPQEPRPARTRRRKVVPALIALVMVGAVVGLVWNLASGSLFFYNADEAVERRDELGDERFTLQAPKYVHLALVISFTTMVFSQKEHSRGLGSGQSRHPDH